MQVSPLLLLLVVVVVVVVVRAYECETEEEAETDRAGSFTAELWHWPGHTVHYTFAGSFVYCTTVRPQHWSGADSVIKEDRRIIRQAMAEIEDNTCMEVMHFTAGRIF